MSSWVNLLDIIYPVGSLYMSFNSGSPAAFMTGTWEQIVGKFLYCNNSGGVEGGESSHSHSLESGGALIDVIGTDNWINIATTANGDLLGTFVPAQKYAYLSNQTNPSVETAFHPIKLTGNTDAQQSLPPYLTIYAWKRIA